MQGNEMGPRADFFYYRMYGFNANALNRNKMTLFSDSFLAKMEWGA